jgi:hypothetical protein
MKKTLRMIAASTLTLGVMIGAAEAKKISYEINGQRFTYDTNDSEQVASARKRIDAANAADAAKTKAEAERARNPLAAAFGSQAQQEAAQAQTRLQQVLTEQAEADAALKRRRAVQAAKEERRKTEEQVAEPAQAEPEPLTSEAEQAPPPAAPRSQAAAEPAPAGETATPTIKSVSFDVGSGIKTTIMTDGAVHEEPFDSSTLAKLDADPEDADSLNAFVNQLRKAVSVETTGSTVSKAMPPR